MIHTEWGEGTVMALEDDRVTVFFDSQGYKTLSLAVVAGHALLRPALTAFSGDRP